jgi:glucokinase
MEVDKAAVAGLAPAAGGAPGLPLPWLVADIGGTNARFGWLGQAGHVQHITALRAADYAGPAAAAQAYLQQVALRLGAAYAPPRAAAFAVATAVGGDEVSFTNNSSWGFSRRALLAQLAVQELLVLNDFEALALSLPRLQPGQLRPWAGVPPVPSVPGATPSQTLAVIGPGTGLGVAGIVPTRRGWVAIPGEGGHVSLSAADDFEADLLRAARQLHPHVSAERLLSGIGLPVLHAAMAAVLGHRAEALSAEAVVERGLVGQDVVCSRCVDAFCALLGSFAGNVALTLGARGGVYIGGGIVPRLGERFFASRFRERFEAKGRFQGYLQSIPTPLITDTLAALGGAALALEQHHP